MPFQGGHITSSTSSARYENVFSCVVRFMGKRGSKHIASSLKLSVLQYTCLTCNAAGLGLLEISFVGCFQESLPLLLFSEVS